MVFKNRFKSCLPVIKNAIQLDVYYHIVQDLSKPTILEGIVDCVSHFDTFGFFDKPMLVVPE